MTGQAVADKWDTVLTRLWRQSRFVSYFYQSVSLVENRGLPTLALTFSDRRGILFYNPLFIAETPGKYLIGLLVHEMLHIVSNHEHRGRPGQDDHLRNLAQDMVINTYLKESERTFFSRKGEGALVSLALPPGLPQLPAAFGKRPGRAGLSDVTWEEVYKWLKARYQDEKLRCPANEQMDEQPPGVDQWQADDSDGDSRLPPDGLRFIDKNGNPLPTGIHLFVPEDAGQQARAGAERIMGFIQKQDDCREERLYSDLSRLIRQPEATANLKWKKAIRTIADQSVQTSRWDYSFSRPNRRFFDAGIYAPGRYLKHKPLLTIVIDVSGSMAANPGEIEAAFGAVEELTRDFRINLLCIDQDLFVPRKHDKVRPLQEKRGHYLYQPGDWRHIKTGSRGATFFAPLFNDYMKNQGEALIVITDGEIYDLDVLDPYYPTFWIVSGNRSRSFSPPFGRVLAM